MCAGCWFRAVRGKNCRAGVLGVSLWFVGVSMLERVSGRQLVWGGRPSVWDVFGWIGPSCCCSGVSGSF